MAIKQTNNPKVDLIYRKRKSAEEMKHQVITFALMIFFNISCICSSSISENFQSDFLSTIYFTISCGTSNFSIVLFYAYES